VTRRTIAGLLASTTATGVLAACGGASQTATGPAGAGAAQPGGPKTLPAAQIGFDTFRGGPNGVWAQEMVKTFKDKFPSVTVEFHDIPLDGGSQQSAYPKMLTNAAAGTLGDVHAWDPSHWQLYQAINRAIIQPIDPFVARDKFDLNQFYKQFIEYQKWQGKTWGLPSWGWTSQDGLLFNTELLQNAGVTMPAQTSADWTMAKIYDVVVQVGKFAARAQNFGLVTTMPSATAVTIWTRAFDSDNLSQDGKKSTILDAKSKDAMRWIYDLATKERVIALPGALEGSVETNFVNGRVAITQQGSLGVFTVNKLTPTGQLKFKAQLLPKRKDGKRPSQLRGGTWNINKTTKFPDHSWEFVKHITDRTGMLQFNIIGGNGALTRPDIMTDDYFKDPNFKVYLENFDNVMPAYVPANFRGTEFENAFPTFGTPWYKGETGFEDGLITLNTEVQKILDMAPI
jgi:ABC-type glycerol-3-phosphate transport system substrate-binding protein